MHRLYYIPPFVFQQEAIVAAADKVCNVLPSTIKSECLSFVSLYLPYIVDLIVQEMPPNQICQELGLCNATMGQGKKNCLAGIILISLLSSHRLIVYFPCQCFNKFEHLASYSDVNRIGSSRIVDSMDFHK